MAAGPDAVAVAVKFAMQAHWDTGRGSCKAYSIQVLFVFRGKRRYLDFVLILVNIATD